LIVTAIAQISAKFGDQTRLNGEWIIENRKSDSFSIHRKGSTSILNTLFLGEWILENGG